MHVQNLLNYCFSLNMEICDFLVMVGEMVQNVYIHSDSMLLLLLLTNMFINIQQLSFYSINIFIHIQQLSFHSRNIFIHI